MHDSEQIEKLQRLIAGLIEANQEVPVVVEGEQDVRCLRQLGLTGQILKVHLGRSLYEFSPHRSDRYDKVILLTDWDRKGDQIHERLTEDLSTDWSSHAWFRQTLRLLCNPDIQEVEHVGRHLECLKNRRQAWQQEREETKAC